LAGTLRELWVFRELMFFLAWRDIKVRYKQTLIGAAWAVLQPTLTMVIFTMFLGGVVGRTTGIPYHLFTYSALLPWLLFAFSVTESGNSLVNNKQLITKVYFPRILVPMGAVLVGLADFAVASLLLVGMLAWEAVAPTPALVLAPLFVFLGVVTALGAGLWLSALNVRYRDVRYTIPFLTQAGLFVTPVLYPVTADPAHPKPWQALYYLLNPMAGVVDGFRWAVAGASLDQPLNPCVWVSVAGTLVLLVSGFWYFQRVERSFADVI
jgi:lipopolysaccharide transport system permease protein